MCVHKFNNGHSVDFGNHHKDSLCSLKKKNPKLIPCI